MMAWLSCAAPLLAGFKFSVPQARVSRESKSLISVLKKLHKIIVRGSADLRQVLLRMEMF